mmetsp:Transcript_28184/g.39194  ORF Transcript_28184/g.39194 Transcript_28184/m.39194 type:complete len:837 (+) Transcript_28184:114-2624(+)
MNSRGMTGDSIETKESAGYLENVCDGIQQMCILINVKEETVLKISKDFQQSFGICYTAEGNHHAPLALLFSEHDFVHVQNLLKGTHQTCAAHLRNSDTEILWTKKSEGHFALLIGWHLERSSNIARISSPNTRQKRIPLPDERLKATRTKSNSRTRSLKKATFSTGSRYGGPGARNKSPSPARKERKPRKKLVKNNIAIMGDDFGKETHDGREAHMHSDSQGTQSSQHSPEDNKDYHNGKAITSREREIADEAKKAQRNKFSRNAHDIRNPLNSVLGYCHLLKRTKLDEDQTDYVMTISEASMNMLKIVNHLLESTREPPFEFAIRPCIESAIEAVAVQKMKSSVNLGMWVSSYVPINIVGIPRKVRQVIINLLNNALKFTSKGAVTIKVWINKTMTRHLHSAYKNYHSELVKICDLTDRSIAELVLEIQDTGIGMSSAETKRLFKAYSQANDSTKSTYGGSGLGLFAVQNFCAEMGGKCWVKSKKGEGSTFYATVRIGIHSINRQEIKNSVPWVTGKRVLIHQRWDFDRKAIEDSLRVYGARTVSLSTKKQLKDELSMNNYHALIMEASAINEEDGDYIQQIRSIKGCEQLPIIAVQDFRSKSLRPLNDIWCTFLRRPIRGCRLITCLKYLANLSEETDSSSESQMSESKPLLLSPQSNPIDFNGFRVLVVDDQKANCKLLCKFFNKAGINAVDSVFSGEQAVAKFKGLREDYYSLIVIDIHLTGIHGFETATQIQKLGYGGHISAMSGNTKVELLQQFNDYKGRSPFQHFLVKPFTPESCLRLAHEVYWQVSESSSSTDSSNVLTPDATRSPKTSARHRIRRLGYRMEQTLVSS